MRVEETKKTSGTGASSNRHMIPPSVTEPSERARAMREIVACMRNNPIPADAPRLTREDLHARS